ncbi:MAG: hypothetical protein U5K27_16910 [Desulfotignum sp.]|nr:hypothetical protein [Desulfotignum sp.]
MLLLLHVKQWTNKKVTRLHINIKDSDKAIIVINLLKELPFVEIENSVMDFDGKPSDKDGKGLEDLFGLWEGERYLLQSIQKMLRQE